MTTPATATLQELKLAQLKSHPSNIREDVGDVAELAASIREHGVLEPLIVIPDLEAKTKTPRFLLLAGHRRLAAAQLAGLKAVPCLVREDVEDPAAQIETMLIENLQRTDLTPMEEARAYQQLLEFPGYTQKLITERTGRPASTVRGRVALTKLSEETQGKIQARQISLADAMVLAEFTDDQQVSDRLEGAVGTSNWRWEVERARTNRERAKAVAKIAAALKKAGIRTITGEELEKLEDDAAELADSTGSAYVDPCVNVFQLGIDPVEHVSCPGHAVDIDDADDWENPPTPDEHAVVCMQPALHVLAEPTGRTSPPSRADKVRDPGVNDIDPDDAVGTDAEIAQTAARDAERVEAQKAAAQAREELLADLATAATVRRAHLAELIARADLRVARDLLLTEVIGEVDRLRPENGTYVTPARRYAAALLVPTRDPATVDVDQLIEAARKLDLARLAIALPLLGAYHHDKTLEEADGWPASGGWPAKQNASWREQLGTVLAYEWSDVELALLEVDADDAAAVAS